jgi:glycosyltransferase involved in cell wall biosynthesis
MVVVSSVYPFPGDSGQQQRVRNKLLAFRDSFHTTYLTVAAPDNVEETRNGLEILCDEVIVLPSLYRRSQLHRLAHLAESAAFAAATGLKRSNYVIGELEFSRDRVAEAIGDRRFDVAVFEYWHAAGSVPVMRAAGARCVLDMHDVLWRSYERQMLSKSWIPAALRNIAVARYREREERAWRTFDALITINHEEHRYVAGVLGEGARLFFTPMGLDLTLWPYSWAPVDPTRVAYYGGLGSPHNQRDALSCYEQIMPLVWSAMPEAEFWIVGSNPPPALLEIARTDERVLVTGFVEDVGATLGSMSVVLCPWRGRFGFRSRVVEAQAIGVPVVATAEAIDGMDLRADVDVLVADTPEKMASAASLLAKDRDLSFRISRSARQRVEELYSFDATYGKLARGLFEWSQDPRETVPGVGSAELAQTRAPS